LTPVAAQVKVVGTEAYLSETAAPREDAAAAVLAAVCAGLAGGLGAVECICDSGYAVAAFPGQKDGRADKAATGVARGCFSIGCGFAGEAGGIIEVGGVGDVLGPV